MKKWIINCKGSPEDGSGEISVVREDNSHGIASYGWFGDRKILIFSNGGPCREKTNKYMWDKFIRLADEVANELNDSKH